jgi:hypothetical protein
MLARIGNFLMMSDGTQQLLLAIVARAVRDLKNPNPQVQQEARQWLMEDSLCAEICEVLEMPLSALHRAAGLEPVS